MRRPPCETERYAQHESDQTKMESSDSTSASSQRDQALLILDSKIRQLSKLYKECYLSIGRGALLVYANDVIKKGLPNEHNYRTKNEILDLFDTPDSKAKLEVLINNYDQQTEGILTLITSHSNATYFVTVKLR
jgi:hypothetical protein